MSGYVRVNRRPLGGHAQLMRLALETHPSDVLDVGCSTGYLARQMAEAGAKVVGIELDPDAAAEARSVCTDVVVGDLETMTLPFASESFDVVLCGDVVEHLRRPGLALQKLRPLIRPSGRLVLTTPNVANWSVRLALLAGRWRYTDRGILDRTHTHLFTRKTLVETVEAAGYRILELDHTVPIPMIGTPTVERVAHAVAAVRPSFFAYQFLLAASPR